jgi:hypothetical protein
MLLRRANTGARGKAVQKIVKKPNCSTENTKLTKKINTHFFTTI